ncbi:MAG: homoserine O-acetyltransferase [Acidimicrobiaceae bacterium]|nr:homoserine O-acetyltransferase [Ilumatobacter sp.]MCB9382553.1 homoserine O-acetyltransferase [Acidimicrobiaceae bacterium]
MTGPARPGRPHPATGAFMPGHPSGSRRFFTMPADRPFALDGGTTLVGVTTAYETWGTLAPDASNAVLLCHAWTGDSHATGPAERGHPTPGWWEGMIGPGLAIDTNRWFVVCPNVLGGCQGSTGPASPHPDDGRPYGSRFPVITIRDMVRVQARLADHLGIRRWHAVVGGSMGGMQVLEWAITYPDRVGGIVPIATCMQSTAQQIAWGAIGRRAIRLDPKWHGGDYYDVADGDGPWEGLAVARMVAQVTFRSDNVFTDRFGREVADGGSLRDGFDLWQRFEVERYLDYHGDKLVRRFDANSYLIIGKAMDLHDIGRGRSGIPAAMARVASPALVMGISSDILYPAYQQRQIHDALAGRGVPSEYVEIDSPHGHDAFLINLEQVGPAVERFLSGLGTGERQVRRPAP